MNVTTIATWILRLLVAAAFLAPAYFKLSGNPMMVELFNQLGLGSWFIYFTGAIELIGALLVLYPPTTPWACLLLLCVMVGAFITNAFVVHHDVLHVFGFAAVLGVLFFLTRHPVMNRISGKAAV